MMSSYLPQLGGMEYYVKTLSEWMAERGHKIIICTLGDTDEIRTYMDGNITVFKLKGFLHMIPFSMNNINKNAPIPINDIIFNKKVSSIIERERPDLIHVHGWMLYSAIALKKKYDIPLLATLHDYGYICPLKTLMNNHFGCCDGLGIGCINCARHDLGLLMSALRSLFIFNQMNELESVDSYIAISPFIKYKYKNYIKHSPIVIIPNFYNNASISTTKKNMIFPEKFILFVGSLTKHKGIYVLINAFNYIISKKNIKDIKLVLCGKSPDDSDLKSNENILIFKNASRQTLLMAYSECQFVIVPSIWEEPFGIVAIEAMGHKKAVIASNVGGLKDIVSDRITGLLVKPNNLKQLSDSIELLLDNPDMAIDMGLCGFERFKANYSSDAVLPKVLSIYESLINRASD